MSRAVGIDFGTTNCAIAALDAEGVPRLATYASGTSRTASFRSILYFERDHAHPERPLRQVAGPRAIESYLEADEPGRLMQSLKSFLASRHFSATNVFGTSFRLEGLIQIILAELRAEAERELGPLPRRVVAGRPVHFAGAESAEDEELALARLRAAFHNAGFEDVAFEYEPIAAAYHYERSLDRDELILIGDFGGGTSDFSLLRVGPSRRREGSRQSILGTDGVALAGDAFDARIVRHAVTPELGRDSLYRSVFGRVLGVPSWIYAHVERWHHLSFLKTRDNLQLLFDLRREALEPAKLEALIHLVRADLGFHLYRTVERAKLELSQAERSALVYSNGPLQLDRPLARSDFEAWIGGELGSSLVPAVRGLFERRFGAERLRSGGELTSVASGLALRARELGEQGG